MAVWPLYQLSQTTNQRIWLLNDANFDSLLSSGHFLFTFCFCIRKFIYSHFWVVWNSTVKSPLITLFQYFHLINSLFFRLACWNRKIICFWHFYWYSNMFLCHFGKFFAVIPPHFGSIHICRTVNIQVFTNYSYLPCLLIV